MIHYIHYTICLLLYISIYTFKYKINAWLNVKLQYTLHIKSCSMICNGKC